MKELTKEEQMHIQGEFTLNELQDMFVDHVSYERAKEIENEIVKHLATKNVHGAEAISGALMMIMAILLENGKVFKADETTAAEAN